MNLSIIRIILGYLLKTESILLLLPTCVGWYYKEANAWYYLLVAIICAALGFLLTLKKAHSNVFYLKEGCVATALSWIFLSVFGCLPFVISGEIPNFINALFETVSGFTTTGASILDDPATLTHCALFWRSFTHWIGGMGVLVFILAVIPLSGGSHINLMRAESPGPSVGKLVPKIKSTARILYIIYFGLSLLLFILLFTGGMPLFDSVCMTFGTAGTGGFGLTGASMGDYNLYLQWVVTVFMVLFGINFNFYYYLIFRQFKKAFTMEEVRKYLSIVIIAVGAITIDLLNHVDSFVTALSQSAFQVASIISSTGFSTTDFNLWSSFSKTIIVLLMFVGACAGSTGGGVKVSRAIVAIKTILKEFTSFIHPKSIKKIELEGKPVEHDVLRSINVFFMTYISLVIVTVLILSFNGYDFETNFTSAITTLCNIGPGLNKVGPAANFNFFSPVSKLVLIFDMLAGRLELFPMLILFHPSIWKGTIKQTKLRHRIEREAKQQNN